MVGNPTWHGMVGNYPGCWYLWETLFSEMTPEFSAFPFQTLHKFGQGAKTRALFLAAEGETSGGQKGHLLHQRAGTHLVCFFPFTDCRESEAQKGRPLSWSPSCAPSCSEAFRALESACLDSNPNCHFLAVGRQVGIITFLNLNFFINKMGH